MTFRDSGDVCVVLASFLCHFRQGCVQTSTRVGNRRQYEKVFAATAAAIVIVVVTAAAAVTSTCGFDEQDEQQNTRNMFRTTLVDSPPSPLGRNEGVSLT